MSTEQPDRAARPWLCRRGFHRLRWERARLGGYWQLTCQRRTFRAMLCFTDRPSRGFGWLADFERG